MTYHEDETTPCPDVGFEGVGCLVVDYELRSRVSKAAFRGVCGGETAWNVLQNSRETKIAQLGPSTVVNDSILLKNLI